VEYRHISDILYDKKVSNKIKDKFYRTTIRCAMNVWCRMLGNKWIKHSEDECSQNADITLDMWPYKERSDLKWWCTGRIWGNTNLREASPTLFAMVRSCLTRASWGTNSQWYSNMSRKYKKRQRLTETDIGRNNKKMIWKNEVYLKNLFWIEVSEKWRSTYQNNDLGS
jgi:hypothetical protein